LMLRAPTTRQPRCSTRRHAPLVLCLKTDLVRLRSESSFQAKHGCVPAVLHAPHLHAPFAPVVIYIFVHNLVVHTSVPANTIVCNLLLPPNFVDRLSYCWRMAGIRRAGRSGGMLPC
jgi:hypothetical protein